MVINVEKELYEKMKRAGRARNPAPTVSHCRPGTFSPLFGLFPQGVSFSARDIKITVYLSCFDDDISNG